MKIIISSSKTMNKTDIKHFDVSDRGLVNQDKSMELVKVVKSYDKDSLARKMHLKNKLADDTYELYQNYEGQKTHQAVSLYSGTVFKQFEIDAKRIGYLDRHLVILSALYGVLNPFSMIRPYRLDMTMKLFETNLYKYWRDEIDEYFKDETIINLASDEYSKMLNQQMINIVFYQIINGKARKVAYHCKVARGLMLDYLIENRVMDTEGIKQFDKGNYKYSEEMSDNHNLVFVKD